MTTTPSLDHPALLPTFTPEAHQVRPCESCTHHPATYTVHLGTETFEVCPGCAPVLAAA